jgi:hypothetical protein
MNFPVSRRWQYFSSSRVCIDGSWPALTVETLAWIAARTVVGTELTCRTILAAISTSSVGHLVRGVSVLAERAPSVAVRLKESASEQRSWVVVAGRSNFIPRRSDRIGIGGIKASDSHDERSNGQPGARVLEVCLGPCLQEEVHPCSCRYSSSGIHPNGDCIGIHAEQPFRFCGIVTFS